MQLLMVCMCAVRCCGDRAWTLCLSMHDAQCWSSERKFRPVTVLNHPLWCINAMQPCPHMI